MGSGAQRCYEVLGPLAVRDGDGVEVRIPVGRQRLLLALLVAAAPRHIGVDALVDELWPDGDGTRGALQVIVHRLRRRIGEDRVVLEPSGYRLVASADDVDAGRFAASVQRAWEAGERDPAGALAALDTALALWRGEPYDGIGLTSGQLDVEATRLREAWLDAREARFSAVLALGRAAEVVGELRELAVQHPLRERVHAQLMLALYRSGRTAEALDAFRVARSAIVEELGLEPGQELRDLEQAILTEDPVLAAPPAPFAVPDVAPRPAQLPGLDAAFVGRGDEVRRVVEALRAGADVVTIDGPAGVGKSAIALHAAHAVADEFDGGTLYANLRGATPGATPRDPAALLERFLHALGTRVPAGAADLGDAAAELRSQTAARRVLVVLDDAASLAQVRHLLPGQGSAAVVTSRVVLAGLAAPTREHVDVVDEELGVAMLARVVGQERVDAEPEAAAKIVAACGRLPLAVRIAGAHLVAAPNRRLAALADRLEEDQARLDELSGDDLEVRASIELGLRDVGGEGSRVFAHLGVVTLPTVTAPAAARLADLPLGVVRRRLDDLARARLLEVTGDELYVLHDLVRLVARERAASELSAAEREAALTRLHAHVLASAQAAGRAMSASSWELRYTIVPAVDPASALAVAFADGPSAAEWVRAEIGMVAAVADAVLRRPRGRRDVAALLAPLLTAFRTQGMKAASSELYAPFLTAEAPLDVADALLLVDAAATQTAPGEMERTTRRAIEAARELGHPELIANALNMNGIALDWDGRHDEAVVRLTEAVDVATRAGVDWAVRITRANLAMALGNTGRYDDANALLEEDLEGLTGPARASTLADIAVNHKEAGRPERSLELYAEAVAGLLASGHTLQAALYTWNHGNALRALGRAEEAYERYAASLELAQGVGLVTAVEAAELLAGEPPEEPAMFERL